MEREPEIRLVNERDIVKNCEYIGLRFGQKVLLEVSERPDLGTSVPVEKLQYN